MNKYKSINSFILVLGSLLVLTPSFAVDVLANPMKIKAETNVLNTDMIVKDNFVKAKYASAENRFLQSNVSVAHEDFSALVERTAHDDYVFLMYGIKMAEYGFYDLSDRLFSKLDKNLYTENYEKDIKNFYYPSAMVKQNEIIPLADAYSNITYNNMALETVSELLNSTQISESDYKNYLIALGYYKSNHLPKALKYINNAITQNDVNISYQILKGKILADSGKSKQALKVLEKIESVDFITVDFQQKVEAAKEYILYKTAKEEPLKDYHLSYYYHLQNKSLLATKVLQSTIIQAKQYAPEVFSLLGRIYYENDEPSKAEEFARRANRENNKNYLSLLTLADLSYEARKYEEALNYYKKAQKVNKKEVDPKVGIAKTYLALDKEKKSKKMFEKLVRKNQTNETVIADSLKVFPYRADEYLPKIASVDITNNEIWLGLAGIAINDGNYNMAESFLNNAYYIDENNFRYYYYLSLILRAKGENELADQSLIRCSNLNSDYAAAISAGKRIYEK